MNLLGFFLLTFVLTWAAWMAPAAVPGAEHVWFFAPGGPLFLLGVFVPGLVALGLTAYSDGRQGVVRLLGRIGQWQVGGRFYAFAVLYMAAVMVAAVMIHRMALGSWPAVRDTPWLLIVGAIVFSTWVQAGEEVGWRGYALPRLAKYVGLGSASLLLGVVWALWHLPLFFLPNTGSQGQSFPLYLLHVTAVSVAMGWLYWRTSGSLLLVMLMHASLNNTTVIVPRAVPGATDPFALGGSFIGWAIVGVAWIVAVPLLFQMRGARSVIHSRPGRIGRTVHCQER